MAHNNIREIVCFIILIIFLVVVPAQAQENEQLSKQKLTKEELTQLLAPVALYPDPILSQMLMAATYPFEVIAAQRWLEKNNALAGEALDSALKEKNWDVSILSLCHYPQVLAMMSDNLDWTAKVGDAFANQQQDVMDNVQELRAKAKVQGNLNSTNEQQVVTEGKNISIQSAAPDVIYVPVYDPYWVYGPWWYPAFLPFPIFYPGIPFHHGRIIFSPGFFVGGGVIGWSNFNWRAHNVVIVDNGRTVRFNRHAAVYRSPGRSNWRLDSNRRFEREKRAHEIPTFRTPARPFVSSPDLRHEGGSAPGRMKPHGEGGTTGRIEPGRVTPERTAPSREEQPRMEKHEREGGVTDREGSHEGREPKEGRGGGHERGEGGRMGHDR